MHATTLLAINITKSYLFATKIESDDNQDVQTKEKIKQVIIDG